MNIELIFKVLNKTEHSFQLLAKSHREQETVKLITQFMYQVANEYHVSEQNETVPKTSRKWDDNLKIQQLRTENNKLKKEVERLQKALDSNNKAFDKIREYMCIT